MGYNNYRPAEAFQCREIRTATRQRQELECQSKELARLTEKEQALLEVSKFDNYLDILLSVHKEQGVNWDWTALASSLPPPYPKKQSHNFFKAKLFLLSTSNQENNFEQQRLEQAQSQDEKELQNAICVYAEQYAEWEKLKSMAQRILAGEQKSKTTD